MWSKVFLKTSTIEKLYTIFKCHKHALKLATTYNMILMYLLVIIYINNQSTLYKVNNVVVYDIQCDSKHEQRTSVRLEISKIIQNLLKFL